MGALRVERVEVKYDHLQETVPARRGISPLAAGQGAARLSLRPARGHPGLRAREGLRRGPSLSLIQPAATLSRLGSGNHADSVLIHKARAAVSRLLQEEYAEEAGNQQQASMRPRA